MVYTHGLYTWIECDNCKTHTASSKPPEDVKSSAIKEGWTLMKIITLCPKCTTEQTKPNP